MNEGKFALSMGKCFRASQSLFNIIHIIGQMDMNGRPDLAGPAPSAALQPQPRIYLTATPIPCAEAPGTNVLRNGSRRVPRIQAHTQGFKSNRRSARARGAEPRVVSIAGGGRVIPDRSGAGPMVGGSGQGFE